MDAGRVCERSVVPSRTRTDAVCEGAGTEGRLLYSLFRIVI